MANTKFVTVEAFNTYMQRIKNYFDKVFEVDSVTRPTSSSNYVVYHVTIPGITSLTENLRVRIHKGLASADPDDGSGALKLLQINNLTPIAIFWRYNSMATWNQLDNVCMTLTYRSNARPTGSDYYGYTLTAGFIMDFTYDSGNDVYSLYDYSAYKVGPTALESYGVVGYSEDGKYNLLIKADGTLTNNPFDYARGAYRWESGAKTANTSYGTWDGYLYERRVASTMSAALISKYGFNTINPEDSIYLKCTKSGRLMTVVGMVKNLPTTADNYYYMLYAHPYQAYTNSTGSQNWSFFTSNPVFKSVNGEWVPLFEECGIPTIIETSASTLQTIYNKYPNQTVNLILKASTGIISAIAQLTICYRSSNNSYYVYGWMKNGASTTANNFFVVWTQSADMTKAWLTASATSYGTQINLVKSATAIQTGNVIVVGALNNNTNCYTPQAKTAIAFDTTQTGKFLCQDGTWKEAGGSFDGYDYELIPHTKLKDHDDLYVEWISPKSGTSYLKINTEKLWRLIYNLILIGWLDASKKDGFYYYIGNTRLEFKNSYGYFTIIDEMYGTTLFEYDLNNNVVVSNKINNSLIVTTVDAYHTDASSGPGSIWGEALCVYYDIFDIYDRTSLLVKDINQSGTPNINGYQKISVPQKSISVELRKYLYNGTYNTYDIHIRLHNLGSEDIGKKIYLYKTKNNTSCYGRDKNIKKWRHPLNYDNGRQILEEGEAERYGFGSYNNDQQGPHVNPPPWMEGEEYITTEWTITQKDIINGYINVACSTDWKRLLKWPDDDWATIEVVGCRAGRHYNLKFKFGLVDQDGTIIYMAPEIVRFGRLADRDVTFYDWYNQTQGGERLSASFVYMSLI